MLARCADSVQTLKVELIDHAYRHRLARMDQTLSVAAEASIEIILRKRPAH